MIITIHQPQFFPWLGYFDKICQADAFVILDDVQYKKNEWQNRNRIKTTQGPQWLTVPVQYHFPEKINEVKINSAVDWRHKHLESIKVNYQKAIYFNDFYDLINSIYEIDYENISALNIRTIDFCLKALKIEIPVHFSSQMPVEGASTQRLINICQRLGADHYLSGAGGQNYLDLKMFQKSKITVAFQEYHHPVYPQLYGEFISHLSVIDLLMNCGPKSLRILGEKNARKAA